MPRFRKRVLVRGKKKNVDRKQNRRIKRLEVMNQPEMKNWAILSATNLVPAQVARGSYATIISTMGQGQGGSSRIGDEVDAHALAVQIYVKDNNHNSNPFRFIVYEDRGYDESINNYAVAGDILSYDNTTDLSVSYISNYNYDNVQYPKYLGPQGHKRFRILFDKMYVSKQQTISSVGYVFNKLLRFKKPIKCQYSASVARGGSSIWVMIFPGMDTTSTDNPSFAWRTELFYTDA